MGKNLLGEALSAVREAIRDTETGLANPASAGRFRTSTGNTGIHEISSRPQSCSFSASEKKAENGIRGLWPASAALNEHDCGRDEISWIPAFPVEVRNRPAEAGFANPVSVSRISS